MTECPVKKIFGAVAVLVLSAAAARAHTEETSAAWMATADSAKTGADAAMAKTATAYEYAAASLAAANDWMVQNSSLMDPQDEMNAWIYLLAAQEAGGCGYVSAHEGANDYGFGQVARNSGLSSHENKQWDAAVASFEQAIDRFNGAKYRYDDATAYYASSAACSGMALNIIALYTGP